jgi:hypothetical protein
MEQYVYFRLGYGFFTVAVVKSKTCCRCQGTVRTLLNVLLWEELRGQNFYIYMYIHTYIHTTCVCVCVELLEPRQWHVCPPSPFEVSTAALSVCSFSCFASF